jgi:hypothetical protein
LKQVKTRILSAEETKRLQKAGERMKQEAEVAEEEVAKLPPLQPVENPDLQALIQEHAPSIQSPQATASRVVNITDTISAPDVHPPQPKKSRVVDYTSLITENGGEREK